MSSNCSKSKGGQFRRAWREQDSGIVIESSCAICGCVLIGKAIFEDLEDQEKKHAEVCIASVR